MEQTLTDLIAGPPNAQFHLASPSALMIAAYYGALVSLVLVGRWPKRLAYADACMLVLLLSAGWQVLETRTDRLRATFLDVGTGDAILM